MENAMTDSELVTALVHAAAAKKAAEDAEKALKAEATRRWEKGSKHSNGNATVTISSQDRGAFAVGPVLDMIAEYGLDAAAFLKVQTGAVRKLPESMRVGLPYIPNETPRVLITK